jgi:excisionase family DNA binding protein
MTSANFESLPWLLFEHQVLELTGYGRNTLEKLVDCGVLEAVKLAGSNQRRFRKTQVAALLALPEPKGAAAFQAEPFLMGEKAVMVWAGFTRKFLRQVVKAGALKMVRPAGLKHGRFQKREVAALLGLSRYV